MDGNRKDIEALRNGDRTVFEKIYKTYFARLLYYSMSIVGDRDAACEIVQSLFLSLWENRRNLDPSGSLRNYLLRGAHNNSLNHQRTSSLHARHHEEFARMSDHVQELPDPDEEPGEAVTRMMERLPERSRQVVYMSYFEDKKSREIAKELGISVRTVETILYQSVKKMKKSDRGDT